MKIVALEQLYITDYTIRFVNCLKRFRNTGGIHIQNVPKDHSMLVYLHKCKAKYTANSGNVVFADPGSVVLIPCGAKYKSEFFPTDLNEGCTFGINLHLYDRKGNELTVSKEPIAVSDRGGYLWELFSQINDNGIDDQPCMALIYSDLYRILGELSGGSRERNQISGKYASIAGAITHLRSEDAYSMKISDMARECGVSESFLCRRFKEYSGLSPVQYIRKRRLQAAKSFLQYSDMSLEEIAYRLNYTDAAYFCKVFHRDTGVTPSQYRKQFLR